MKFSELGLAKRICDDVEKLGFTEPTEIQEKTIPAVLAGHDIMASAETGSGKTAAYGLPIVQALRGGSKVLPRVLVLVPTRELAVQVNDELVRFANKCGIKTTTIYGGSGFERQTRILKRGVDVIVATPGRLNDHIEQGNADLRNIQLLVLDEADRMLDMGFTPQVRRIVSEIKGPRQTVMFSATINKAVEKTGEEFLTDPVRVYVNTNRVEPASIDQKIHLVPEADKFQLLVKMMNEMNEEAQQQRTVLVFTRTRSRASKICKTLNNAQISAGEIHSDISQNKRESTLRSFRDGRISVLVATDIAARGLDVPAISHVINVDLPLSAADYVHRIGRTGRAGRSGIAISFVSDEQRYLVRDIEKVTGRSLDPNSPFSKSRSDAKAPDNKSKRTGNPYKRNGGHSSGRNGQSNGRNSSFKRDGHQSSGAFESRKRSDSQSGERNSSFKREVRQSDWAANSHQGNQSNEADGDAAGSRVRWKEGDRQIVSIGKPKASSGGRSRKLQEITGEFRGKREGFGGKREEFGGKREGFGGKREEFGGKREGFGGKREGFGAKREEFRGKTKEFQGKSKESPSKSRSNGFAGKSKSQGKSSEFRSASKPFGSHRKRTRKFANA